MSVYVEIVAETKVDFTRYLSLCKPALGRSVSQGVDRNNKPISSLADFVCTLDEIEFEYSDCIDSLREATDKLEHISFTMVVLAPEYVIYSLIRKSYLKIINTPTTQSYYHLGIVSGSLAQWKQAVINNSIKGTNQMTLELMNMIVNRFDEKGLSIVFSKFDRKDQGNGTFLLLLRVK